MTDLKASSVTKKGQFTIPKALREKYGIKDKIMIEEGERGIIIKPLLSQKKNLPH